MPEPDIQVSPVGLEGLPRDYTARLTDQSAAKFRALKRAAQRSADLMRPAQERAREKHHAYRQAEDAFDRVRVDFSAGRLTRTVDAVDDSGKPYRRREPDEKAYRRAEAERDRARLEWEDERDEAAALAAHWNAVGGLCTDLESWLRNLPRRARIVDHDGKAPTLRKGETAADALRVAERDLQALQTRRATLEAAPVPAAEVKSAIRRHVESLARAGGPDVSHALMGGDASEIRWTQDRASVLGYTADGKQVNGSAVVTDALCIAAWLDPDRLIARLEQEVDDLAGDQTDAVSSEDRQAQLAEIETAMLATERVIEHWTTNLEQAGVAVLRRRNADARAVLGVTIEGASR